jgi:phage gp29-like protein
MEISDTGDNNELDEELTEGNVTETEVCKSKEILRELSKSKFADEQVNICVQPPRNAGVPKKYL